MVQLRTVIRGCRRIAVQRKELQGMFGNAVEFETGLEEELQLKQEAARTGAVAQLRPCPVPRTNDNGLPDNLNAPRLRS